LFFTPQGALKRERKNFVKVLISPLDGAFAQVAYYELQESMEHPGLFLAHSGRLAA
jgi:hypothetical protein